MARKRRGRALRAAGPSVSGLLVKVLVGTSKKEFTLCKELLCSSSGYLKAALSNEWREAQTRTIELPEDDEDTFELYLQWLYSTIIWSANIEDGNREKGADDTEQTLLARAYTLGDKLQDSDFKDAVLDALMAKLVDDEEIYNENYDQDAVHHEDPYGPSLSAIKWVWNYTMPSSPARRVIIDYFTWHGCCPPLRSFNAADPTVATFFKDLAIHLYKRRSPEGPSPLTNKGNCDYHEHGDSKPCYKLKGLIPG
ncbi:MAG: hypothetical protein M1821_004637 [Bathelium mastoideum]|nr:MAG: hypothetical protein M1821_004637 [Bathelium mastoideum]KAI9688895.1 MAG: hypothetical protein M1822_001252 [Bathelium mastoideum]